MITRQPLFAINQYFVESYLKDETQHIKKQISKVNLYAHFDL